MGLCSESDDSVLPPNPSVETYAQLPTGEADSNYSVNAEEEVRSRIAREIENIQRLEAERGAKLVAAAESAKRPNNEFEPQPQKKQSIQDEVAMFKRAQEEEARRIERQAKVEAAESLRKSALEAERRAREAELARQRAVEAEIKRLLREEEEEEERKRAEARRRKQEEERKVAEELVERRRREEEEERRLRAEFEEQRRQEQEVLKRKVHEEKMSKFKVVVPELDSKEKYLPQRPSRKAIDSNPFAMRFEQLSQFAQVEERLIRERVDATKKKKHVVAASSGLKEAIQRSTSRLAKALSREIMGKNCKVLSRAISKDLKKSLSKEALKASKNSVVRKCSNGNISKASRSLSRESLSRNKSASKPKLERSVSTKSLHKKAPFADQENRTAGEMQNYLISCVLFDGQEEVKTWKKRSLGKLSEEGENVVAVVDRDKLEIERRQKMFDSFRSDMEEYLSLVGSDKKGKSKKGAPGHKAKVDLERKPIVSINKIKDLFEAAESNPKVPLRKKNVVGKIDRPALFSPQEQEQVEDNRKSYVPTIIDQDAFARTMNKFEQYGQEEQERERRKDEVRQRLEKQRKKQLQKSEEEEEEESGSEHEEANSANDDAISNDVGAMQARIRQELEGMKQLEDDQRARLAAANQKRDLIRQIREEVDRIAKANSSLGNDGEEEECPKWIRMIQDATASGVFPVTENGQQQREQQRNERVKVDDCQTIAAVLGRTAEEKEGGVADDDESCWQDVAAAPALSFEESVQALLDLLEENDAGGNSKKSVPKAERKNNFSVMPLLKFQAAKSRLEQRQQQASCDNQSGATTTYEVHCEAVKTAKSKLLLQGKEQRKEAETRTGFIGRKCSDIKNLLLRKEDKERGAHKSITEAKRKKSLIKVPCHSSTVDEKQKPKPKKWSYQNKNVAEIQIVLNGTEDLGEKMPPVVAESEEISQGIVKVQTDKEEEDQNEFLANVREYLEQSPKSEKDLAFRSTVLGYLELIEDCNGQRKGNSSALTLTYPALSEAKIKLNASNCSPAKRSNVNGVGKLDQNQLRQLETQGGSSDRKADDNMMVSGVCDSIKAAYERQGRQQGRQPTLKNFQKKKIIHVVDNRGGVSSTNVQQNKDWKWKQKTLQELHSFADENKIIATPSIDSKPKQKTIYRESSGNIVQLENKSTELQKAIENRDKEFQDLMDQLHSYTQKGSPYDDSVNFDNRSYMALVDDRKKTSDKTTELPMLPQPWRLEQLKERLLQGTGDSKGKRAVQVEQKPAKKLSEILLFRSATSEQDCDDSKPDRFATADKARTRNMTQLFESGGNDSGSKTVSQIHLAPRKRKIILNSPFQVEDEKPPPRKPSLKVSKWSRPMSDCLDRVHVQKQNPTAAIKSKPYSEVKKLRSKPGNANRDTLDDLDTIPSHVLKDEILYRRYMKQHLCLSSGTESSSPDSSPERSRKNETRSRRARSDVDLSSVPGSSRYIKRVFEERMNDKKGPSGQAGQSQENARSCSNMKQFWEGHLRTPTKSDVSKTRSHSSSGSIRKMAERLTPEESRKADLVKHYFNKGQSKTGRPFVRFQNNFCSGQTSDQPCKKKGPPPPPPKSISCSSINQLDRPNGYPQGSSNFARSSRTGAVNRVIKSLESTQGDDDDAPRTRSACDNGTSRRGLSGMVDVFERRELGDSCARPNVAHPKTGNCAKLRGKLVTQMSAAGDHQDAARQVRFEEHVGLQKSRSLSNIKSRLENIARSQQNPHHHSGLRNVHSGATGRIISLLDSGTITKGEANELLDSAEERLKSEYISRMQSIIFAPHSSEQQYRPQYQPPASTGLCSSVKRQLEQQQANIDLSSRQSRPTGIQKSASCSALKSALEKPQELQNNQTAFTHVSNMGNVDKVISMLEQGMIANSEAKKYLKNTENELKFATISSIQRLLFEPQNNSEPSSAKQPVQTGFCSNVRKMLVEQMSADLGGANAYQRKPDHNKGAILQRSVSCSKLKLQLEENLGKNQEQSSSATFAPSGKLDSKTVDRMRQLFQQQGRDFETSNWSGAGSLDPGCGGGRRERANPSFANILSMLENGTAGQDSLEKRQIQAELEHLRVRRNSISFEALEKADAKNEMLQNELAYVRLLRQGFQARDLMELGIGDRGADERLKVSVELEALRGRKKFSFDEVGGSSSNDERDRIRSELEAVRAMRQAQDRQRFSQSEKAMTQVQQELEALKAISKKQYGSEDELFNAYSAEKQRLLEELRTLRQNGPGQNAACYYDHYQQQNDIQMELAALKSRRKFTFGEVGGSSNSNDERDRIRAELEALRRGEISHHEAIHRDVSVNDERTKVELELQALRAVRKKSYGSEDAECCGYEKERQRILGEIEAVRLARRDVNLVLGEDSGDERRSSIQMELEVLRGKRKCAYNEIGGSSAASAEDRNRIESELKAIRTASGIESFHDIFNSKSNINTKERMGIQQELEFLRSMPKRRYGSEDNLSAAYALEKSGLLEELEMLRRKRKYAYGEVGGSSASADDRERIEGELEALRSRSGIGSFHDIFTSKSNISTKERMDIQQELDCLRSMPRRKFGSEDNLSSGYAFEKKGLLHELEHMRRARRNMQIESSSDDSSRGMTERERIQLELEALRESRRKTGLSRINHGDQRHSLQRSASSSGIAGESSKVDLDEGTLSELRVTNSMVKAMFEASAPKYRFGGRGQGLSAQEEQKKPGPVMRKSAKPKEERKWVADTINKYFDVIVEGDEEEACDKSEDGDEEVFYPDSSDEEEDEDEKQFKSTSNIRSMLSTVLTRVSSKVGASKETLADKLKMKLGNEVIPGRYDYSVDY